MSIMTWKQFRDYVDSQLKEKGIDENTEIQYIDFSWPDMQGKNQDEIPIGVYCDDLNMIEIH
jgi:hypothetical protein